MHKAVVIVVPALAEGDQRQHEIVATFVGGGEASSAPDVRHRVDAKRCVIKDYGRKHVAPEERSEAPESEDGRAQNGGRHPVVAVEPAELGKLGEVADQGQVVFVVSI